MPTTVNVQDAKTRLSELLKSVEAGESVIIARAGRPIAELRPLQKVDLVYLCFPNNPNGAVASRERLAQWVQYAKANDAVILFDAAYEAYITEPAIPHSIYEIPGARDVAIEFRSFSKTAGFRHYSCGHGTCSWRSVEALP